MMKLMLALLAVTNINAALKDIPSCCTFEEPDTCQWVGYEWHYSTDLVPNTDSYPGFSWDSNYMWLQDTSGNMETTQIFDIASENSVFSFDFYFNIKNGGYLQVSFNIGKTNPIILGRATNPQDAWLHMDIPCSKTASNDYCCGSKNDFPCSGTITVTGLMEISTKSGLMAIDNIGTCDTGPVTTSAATTTTTTTITTLTTPTTTEIASTTEKLTTTSSPEPSGCCDFEADTCQWTLGTWQWSSEEIPPPPLPSSNTGKFVWTTENGATMQMLVPNVVESTEFTLYYYLGNATSGNDNIAVAFKDDDGNNNVQAFMTYRGDQWYNISADCSPKPQYDSSGCCQSYPCTVTVIIEVSTTSAVFGVDNTGINMYCG